MKTILSLTCMALFSVILVGCIDAGLLLGAAHAALKAYEASVDKGSDEYKLADKLDDELSSLNILYGDAEAAATSAKPGYESKIAAVVVSIAADGKSFLALVAIKNPQKQQIASGVIAAAEAYVWYVQDRHPDPSGNSAQLNSTEAQIKAAAKAAPGVVQAQ